MTINPYTGLVMATGEPDTGKTAFGLTSKAQPEQIAFFDDDIKGQVVNEQVQLLAHKFAVYHNLTRELSGMRETQIHDYCIRAIETLPSGLSVIVWDTWTRFENTLFNIVKANPARFRESYAPKGEIAMAEKWIASFDYESDILDRLLGKAPLVILTAHTKPYRIGGGAELPGKTVPAIKRPLIQKPIMRIWLRHNPNSPAPIGLVLKRPQRYVVTDDGLQLVNVLPRRLDPCTWDTLIEYWNDPIGNRKPTVAETPNEFELSILDATLTRDQREMLKVLVANVTPDTIEDDDEPRDVLLTQEQIALARELRSQGKRPAEIARELGVDVPQLMAAISDLMG